MTSGEPKNAAQLDKGMLLKHVFSIHISGFIGGVYLVNIKHG